MLFKVVLYGQFRGPATGLGIPYAFLGFINAVTAAKIKPL